MKTAFPALDDRELATVAGGTRDPAGGADDSGGMLGPAVRKALQDLINGLVPTQPQGPDRPGPSTRGPVAS